MTASPMAPPYQHIIWDWNGTLLDDAWLCVEIMNGMLARRARPALSAERYAAIFDFPVSEYYLRAGWDFAQVPFESLSTEFINEYNRRREESPLREGATDVLARIRELGMGQSILSASEHQSLVDVITHKQIHGYFSAIRGIDNHHAAGKTALGLAWLEEMDVDPRAVLFIGDTSHDFEVATAMGVDCALVFSGHMSRERLARRGVPVFAGLGELGSWLNTSG